MSRIMSVPRHYQDFEGSLGVYPELGDEGSVQVRASDLLKMMGV